jgi:hypothetical protein
MRLISMPDAKELEKLRIHKGDVVDYQGTRYVADQVGMRYVQMHLLSDPRITGFAKIRDVSKWFPLSPDEMEDQEISTPLLKRQN